MDYFSWPLIKFTPQEQRILNYLRLHPQAIAQHSAEKLAALTWTSAATLNRLGRKLGFNGFSDFKLQTVTDLKNGYPDTAFFLANFNESNMTNEIFLTELNKIICFENRRLLQSANNHFQQALMALRNANHIDIYATGNNLPYAHIAARKLSCSGKTTRTFHYVEDDHLNNLPATNLSFIVSRTGNNPLCLYAAEKLLNIGQPVIAITGEFDSPLATRCPWVLPFWYQAQAHPLNRIIEADSLNYLFNALWFGMSQPD